MDINIPKALNRLRRRINRLGELLAWKELQDGERPIEGLQPRRRDPAPEEIAAAFGAAISLAQELQQTLDATSFADARQRCMWQDRLREMAFELAVLNPTETFISR